LRRLDRVDTIVLDEDVLVSSQLVVGDVEPLAGTDPGEAAVRAHALFGRAAATGGGTGGVSRDGDGEASEDGWVLGPFGRSAAGGRDGGGTGGAATAGGGAVDVLVSRGAAG
jgi:hypothetical protein